MEKKNKKCFSSCRKLEKSKCDKPLCVMTNGKKYKYCRLSDKYKLVE